jgi:hypothetical protein
MEMRTASNKKKYKIPCNVLETHVFYSVALVRERIPTERPTLVGKDC